MGCKKFFIAGIFMLIVFGAGFVDAAHVIGNAAGGTTFSSVVGVSTLFNFSVQNTNSALDSGTNLTKFKVILPAQCSFDSGSQGTSNPRAWYYEDNITSFVWRNDTSYVVYPGTTEYFWIDISCSIANSYTINIETMNSTGIYLASLSLIVTSFPAGGGTDAVAPIVEFGTNPVNNYQSNTNDLVFDFRCSDNVGISSVAFWINLSHDWAANYTVSPYFNGSWVNYSLEDIDYGGYVWGVFCTDTSGNSVWTTNRTFFVEDPGLNDSDGFYEYSYSITEDQFKKGYTNEILERRRIIFKHEDEYHSVGLIEVTNDSAVINVSSDSQQEVFHLGDVKVFEITGDRKYDIEVTLNSIANHKANITMISVNTSVPDNETVGGDMNQSGNLQNETELGSENEEEKQGNGFGSTLITLIVSIVLIVVVGFIVYKFFFKESKEEVEPVKKLISPDDDDEDDSEEDEEE